jgi:hypothetical protein
VRSGYVKTSDMVFAGNLMRFVGRSHRVSGLDGRGFVSVGNLMTLVNNALAEYPTGCGGSAARRYLRDLTLALRDANHNAFFAHYSE